MSGRDEPGAGRSSWPRPSSTRTCGASCSPAPARASAPAATSRAWRPRRRPVGARQHRRRPSTASGSTSAPPPASCSRCPSRRSPRCPARRPARACRWRWPATCGSWPASAILTTAFARVGFSGDYGGTYFLTQLVGLGQGARAVLPLRAGQRRRGAAPGPRQLGRARPRSWPAKTARDRRCAWPPGPTVAYRYMKENLNRAMAGEVDDCLDLEATHHVHCGQTEDHREAAGPSSRSASRCSRALT